MDTSKVWINHREKSRKQSFKPKKRKTPSMGNRSQYSTNSKRNQVAGKINYTPNQVTSLFETIASIAKKVDLVNLRNQITEINQICEQVNGIMQQLGHLNRPAYPSPSRGEHPYNPSNYSHIPPSPNIPPQLARGSRTHR